MKLTAKQEKYALCLFQGMTQRDSWKVAGYCINYPIETIDSKASVLANSVKVRERLEALRNAAASPTIMEVQERKERLSEIARARLTDFIELGQDGSWVNIGPETKFGGAISEIHSRTEYDKNGANPTVYTSVKLHNPVGAIAELNKMEHIYNEAGQDVNVNIQNNQVNVIVNSEKSKQLTERVLSGEGTE